MVLQVVSPAVNVYKILGVKDGAEQVEEFTFRRGETLPDWISTHQKFVLTTTGMAREVGDFVDPALVKAEDVPAPVVMPESTPLMVIGTDVTAPATVVKTHTDGAKAVGVDAGSDPGAELPKDSDTKPVWEDFAVARGFMPRAKAESLRKPELVEQATRAHKKAQADEAKAAKASEAKTAEGKATETGTKSTRSTLDDPAADPDAKLPPKFGR